MERNKTGFIFGAMLAFLGNCILIGLMIFVLVPLPLTQHYSYHQYQKEKINIMRTINWSGFTWNVIPPMFATPGPNYWSDSANNIWIDAQNNLHLKITNVGGKWYCAAIETTTPVGYGTYTIGVVSDPTIFDVNAIAGLFYYLDDYDELDIEFSRWGDSGANNTQYSIQGKPPTVSPLYETNGTNTIHKMIWDAESVSFLSSVPGVGPWTYTGSWKTKLGSVYCINLWLMEGLVPVDGMEQELILSSFSYVPEEIVCSIVTTVPSIGLTYRKGERRIINWTSTGNIGTNVKIQLLRSGTVVKTISTGTVNDGSFSWTVPSVSRNSNYQIKITSKTNSLCSGISGKFTIR